MQEIKCVLCEGSHDAAVISENGFTGRQCSNCGLIFVSPRPTRQQIDEVYEKGEAYLSPEWFVQTPESLSAVLRARRDAKLIQRHIAGGSLLEIGPGRGTFLVAARERGFEVAGVELNPTQAAFIETHHGIPCAQSLEAAATVGPGQYDVIYHRDVLSHFYDPHEEMGRLRDRLKPDGLQIFETGNLGDVDHRYLGLIRSFQYPDHLFFYGDRSLKRLLDQTGFELVHTYRWSVLPDRWVRARLTALLRRLNTLLRGHRNLTADGAATTAAVPPAAAGHGRAGQIARQALDLFYYGLHRTVDAIPVAETVPQTLIVVARKR